jgi:sulfoquinovosidase
VLFRPKEDALRRATFVVALACALAPSFACEDEATPVELGSGQVRVRVDLDPFTITIVDDRGREVLRSLSGGGTDAYGSVAATRDDGPDTVKAIPGWDGYVPEERPWAHGRSARLTTREASHASFELPVAHGVIVVDVDASGARARIAVRARGAENAEWNKVALSFVLRPDEHFFGLGERYASIDHRGLSLYSWAEEGGAGKGEDADPRAEGSLLPNGPSMTYFPVPFFLSSEGYAVHLTTTRRTENHLGSERSDAWRVAVNATELEAIVYVHSDPRASLDDFTRESGRPLVPARWVFGPRRRTGYDSMVGDVEEWRMLRLRHVPTTGLDDATHFLPARHELGREDVLREWVNTAHAFGYKVMAYNNPHVSTSEEAAHPDLEYGVAHDLLVKNSDGGLAETSFISGSPQTVATIDLTKPEAVAWFQELLGRTLALGYDGWMHDFGEYVRRSWRFADGRDGAAVHNEFPVLSARAAYDLLARERPGDFLFFVRSGYTGTQAYVPAVWGGDPEATFDATQGIPAMLRGGLSLGMSGVPVWGSDMTGFKCLTDFPYDKEMYLRWAELGAVSPIMMEQNACANPLGRREKWKLWNDDETVLVYAAMARLHTRLAPYFEVLAREAHTSGMPIMRHPFLLHPHEREAWTAESSFYLGPSLWAAPVVRRGETLKETWLPVGRWVDLSDYRVYEGGARVAIPAPLAKLPLLLADGGIVPMLDPAIETLALATDPSVVSADRLDDRLDVLVALSAGREAHVILADGTELSARRVVSSGTPSGLSPVGADRIESCDEGCVWEGPVGMVDRVRVTTPKSAVASIAHGDLVLEFRAPSARTIRWDVLRLR